ncbi:potassium channel protein [candidate division KSB1 bacterium]|nr:potassium channel protein [candidate division KSB1 bacterium]
MNKLYIAPILLCVIVLIGTLGYILIEGWILSDAFYMTIITIATVGYNEVQELSTSGRIFTSILIFLGIGIGGYAVATISAFLIEGQLREFVKGRRMDKKIEKLKDHVILCGYGKIGKEVALNLKENKVPFVIAEKLDQKVIEAIEQGYPVCQGDASDEQVLEKCRIADARGLISAISADSANVFLVLTAREMNKKLRIVARGTDEFTEKRLKRAGADMVISPYAIAGARMACWMMNPKIVEFLEVMQKLGVAELMLEETIVGEKSSIANKRLNESKIKQVTEGASILAIRKHKTDQIMLNPQGASLVEVGDVLVALGTKSQLEKLQELTA